MNIYVIVSTTSETKFLAKDNIGKNTAVTNIKNASKWSIDKAFNVLNTIPKKERDLWKIEDEDKFKPTRVSYESDLKFDGDALDFDVFDIDGFFNTLQTGYQNLSVYKENLSKALSKVEEELTDCIHACEFFKYDAARGYKMYKMLHERRAKRRFLKNELFKARVLMEAMPESIVNGTVGKRLETVRNLSYEPRALKELFPVEGRKESTQ